MSFTPTSISPRDRAISLADGILRDFYHALRRAVNLYNDGDEVMGSLIIPQAMSAIESAGLTITEKTDDCKCGHFTGYTGEIRLIDIMLGGDCSWTQAIRRMRQAAEKGNGKMFNCGDYLYVPVNVPEITIDGYKFEAIKGGMVRLVVTAAYEDKICMNFEEILFHAPVNTKNTKENGFKASLLAQYLNNHFLHYVFNDVSDCLRPNIDGLKVSVPTWVEVFGKDDDGDYTVENWTENEGQQPYFEKCTNRIKVRIGDRNDTHWYWLHDPSASHSTYFAVVSTLGSSHTTLASSVGGVAPAFCVA